MTTSAWLQLLPNLPPAWKDSLVVKTINGTELSVQSIVRIDELFVVIRGRVAGTTEQGQVYFVPIDRIETICIQKPPREEEMQKTLNEMFGSSVSLPPVIEKTSDNLRATTIMRLSPEAHERLKSLSAASKQSNPPAP
ncbi:MAG: hypothetical protein EBT92_18720 [Planctomycetes bacterium]|nr:hypothetical protein [Planctomycetota bacterium]NBY01988.1 hypothetical protein [Planctomycetota bacterium]